MSCSKKDDKSCGWGLTMLVAGVAAGYFLYGKNGEKNRTKVKGWMLKAKGEVLEKIEKLKDVDEDDYNKVIDSVSSKYSKLKNIDKEEVLVLMDELRAHWKKIEKDTRPKRAKLVKKVTKEIKKGVKKAKEEVHKRTTTKK